MPKIEIHGYAIVSDNDCIADAAGRTPDILRNDADWAYFQAELNRSAVTVLGRLGHEANPNPKGRLRMILSSSASGLERRADGWWWNPEALPWDQAIGTVLPEGGRVAVPGGRRVFDLFLAIGYDAFHLTRAEGTLVPNGVTGLLGLPGRCERRSLAVGARPEGGRSPDPRSCRTREPDNLAERSPKLLSLLDVDVRQRSEGRSLCVTSQSRLRCSQAASLPARHGRRDPQAVPEGARAAPAAARPHRRRHPPPPQAVRPFARPRKVCEEAPIPVTRPAVSVARQGIHQPGTRPQAAPFLHLAQRAAPDPPPRGRLQAIVACNGENARPSIPALARRNCSKRPTKGSGGGSVRAAED